MAGPYRIIKLFVERFKLASSHVETKPNNDNAKNCLYVFFMSLLEFLSLFLKLFEHLNDFVFWEIFTKFYVFNF